MVKNQWSIKAVWSGIMVFVILFLLVGVIPGCTPKVPGGAPREVTFYGFPWFSAMSQQPLSNRPWSGSCPVIYNYA